MGGQVNDCPIIFDVLIDHRSSRVLIGEEYMLKLELRHKCLKKPYTAELTIENNGHKVNISFSEYVKLQLHDPSS
jgi:hypothetical protein